MRSALELLFQLSTITARLTACAWATVPVIVG